MASPIITPAGPLNKDGKSITGFTSDQAVTWNTSGGILSNVTSTTVDWQAPNQTGNWILSGDNGSDPETSVQITVLAIIPNYWEFKVPIKANKSVLIFRPIYGPSQFRGFGGNETIHDWELSNGDSSNEEFLEIKTFWMWHYPGKQVDMIDPVLNERRRYEIDSDFAENYSPGDGFSWGFRIKEVFPYAIIA